MIASVDFRPTLIAALLAAVVLHAQDTGAVEGRVINGVTGVGISGATVRLIGRGDNHYETVSDGAGTFHISGVRPGDYVASVEKSSFHPCAGEPFASSGSHRLE